jgi:hypothetical protein
MLKERLTVITVCINKAKDEALELQNITKEAEMYK